MESKNISVLLVEDDVNILNALYVAMKPLFKEVFTATNGEEALSIYNNNHIDVVITDMNMPKVNGAELIDTIRSQDISVPIVITTGYQGFECTYESMFNIFVYSKPVNIRELYQVILSIEDDIIKIREAKNSFEKLKEVSIKAKEILKLLQENREQ